MKTAKTTTFWKPVKSRKPLRVSSSVSIFSKKTPPIFTPGYKVPTKGIKKTNMNWIQVKTKYPRMSPFKDADKDGVSNMFDCKPLNKRQQGGFHKKAGFALTDMYGFAQERPGKSRTKSMRDSIHRDNETVSARLWNTDVATLNPQTNTLTVRSGGWQTRTTKERINKALPDDMSISTKKGRWMVNTRQGEVPFEENMQIEVDSGGMRGRVRGKPLTKNWQEVEEGISRAEVKREVGYGEPLSFGEERVMPGYQKKKVIPVMKDDERGHEVSFKPTNYQRKTEMDAVQEVSEQAPAQDVYEEMIETKDEEEY
jgi:hypothetical protein